MNINLLPWRIQIVRKKWIQVLQHWGICFFVCVMVLIILKPCLSIKMLHQVMQNKIIQNQIAQITLDPHFNDKNTLLKKLQKTRVEKSNAIKINEHIEQYLSLFANQLPTTITLTEIRLSPSEIILNGFGASLSDIHQYRQNLQQSKQGKTILLSDIQNDENLPSTLKFKIKITL